MSDTPRTDAEVKRNLMCHFINEKDDDGYGVKANFARTLERELTRSKTLAEENGKLAHKTACELAEAKQEIERLDTRGIHSCHDNCQRPNCVLRRELKAVTEQRDRLAEALLPFSQIGDIVNDTDCTLWKRSVSAGSVRKAREALAAVKGQPHE
jgi:hypothetical protein